MSKEADIRSLHQFGIPDDAYELALQQTGSHHYACHWLLLMVADVTEQHSQKARVFQQIIHHREALNLPIDAYRRSIERLSKLH